MLTKFVSDMVYSGVWGVNIYEKLRIAAMGVGILVCGVCGTAQCLLVTKSNNHT